MFGLVSDLCCGTHSDPSSVSHGLAQVGLQSLRSLSRNSQGFHGCCHRGSVLSIPIQIYRDHRKTYAIITNIIRFVFVSLSHIHPPTVFDLCRKYGHPSNVLGPFSGRARGQDRECAYLYPILRFDNNL